MRTGESSDTICQRSSQAAKSALRKAEPAIYARFQKVCFYGGLVGLGIMMLLLLFNSKDSFIANFNEQSLDLYGVENAYQATLAAGTDGFTPSGLFGQRYDAAGNMVGGERS